MIFVAIAAADTASTEPLTDPSALRVNVQADRKLATKNAHAMRIIALIDFMVLVVWGCG